MAQLTAFGREVRKLRIDRSQTLKEMADEMQLSSAFLSAVETGHKPLPEGFSGRVVKYFRLTGEDKKRLETAASMSQRKLEINLVDATDDGRVLALAFARKFPNLSRAQAEQFLELLKEK